MASISLSKTVFFLQLRTSREACERHWKGLPSALGAEWQEAQTLHMREHVGNLEWVWHICVQLFLGSTKMITNGIPTNSKL
eukprot:5903421-Amphidinium_carterae.1